MDIRIHDREAVPQAAVSAHARQRLQCRPAHRSDRVRHVEVRLGSTGNRRSHEDIYCLMQVQLDGAPAATVVDIGADAFDTIDGSRHSAAALEFIASRGSLIAFDPDDRCQARRGTHRT